MMFFIFLLQIFFRYVIRQPLSWTMEAVSILFVWITLFGSCYAFRSDQHIRFSLFYDKMPKKWGELSSFLGNAIVAVLMILSFVPTVKFIHFMKIQSSSVMHISMEIIYWPYLFFLVVSVIYTIHEMVMELKTAIVLWCKEKRGGTK